jgi:hypothetical protein
LPPPYFGPTITIISKSVTSNSTTVGIKCSNCTNWSGGGLDTWSTAGCIYAYGINPPSDPSEIGSSFSQHEVHKNFALDLNAAHINTSLNTPPPIILGKPNSAGLTQHQTVRIYLDLAKYSLLSYMELSWPLHGLCSSHLGLSLSGFSHKRGVTQQESILSSRLALVSSS